MNQSEINPINEMPAGTPRIVQAPSEAIDHALLRLLHVDRVSEARESQKDNPAALEALKEIEKRIEQYDDFNVGCSECDSWDGISRRCQCSNRRVYWLWNQESQYWSAEVY